MVDKPEIEFRPMEIKDIPGVMKIERVAFPTPWSEEIFAGDLTDNDNSSYIVGFIDNDLVAYAGIWILNEVGHITTIAVRDDYRGMGYGRTTLLAIMELGRTAGVEKFTLEVMDGNNAAIKMYENHGFRHVGRRKNYYREVNKDAIVMWTGEPPYEG